MLKQFLDVVNNDTYAAIDWLSQYGSQMSKAELVKIIDKFLNACINADDSNGVLDWAIDELELEDIFG